MVYTKSEKCVIVVHFIGFVRGPDDSVVCQNGSSCVVVIHCIYSVTDPCDSVICENDGTCREIDTETHECDCAPGLSGMNCQTGNDLFVSFISTNKQFVHLSHTNYNFSLNLLIVGSFAS